MYSSPHYDTFREYRRFASTGSRTRLVYKNLDIHRLHHPVASTTNDSRVTSSNAKPAMKFLATLVALPALVSAVSLSYDPVYDNRSNSLTIVACSTGDHGLITRGFTTFGSLPRFPHIGGAPAVTGFDSPACGTCWQLTFTNGQGVRKSINVLAIDVGRAGFNIAQAAMDELTGGRAVELGRVDVAAVQVAASVCGL